MSNEEKKGLWGRVLGQKKSDQRPCCGGYRIEPITDDEVAEKPEAREKDKAEDCKSNSCCCQ